MSTLLKIRRVEEIEAPNLPDWLKTAANESGKAVTAICGDAGISTQYWYDLIKGRRDAILETTLKRIEESLGKVYAPQEDAKP